MVIKTLYHFVDSNLGAEISSKKRSKQKRWGRGGEASFERWSAWEAGKWHTLGKEGFAWRDQGLGETILINYKINFIQDNCLKLSLHFKSTFHWLLQFLDHTKNAYFSRISFLFNHSSVPWGITLLYFFT